MGFPSSSKVARQTTPSSSRTCSPTSSFSELRDGGFDYQEEKTLRLRVEFLVALGLHERFVEAAAELGARAWIPIVAMAEASMRAGRRALALSIFAAADQPGLQREHLRGLCVKLTGESSTSSALRRVK